MKRLANIYNKLAETYDEADRFKTLSSSHDIAARQIQQQVPSSHLEKAIELGVGHGSFIKKLKPFYTLTDWTGVDLSREMLAFTRINIGINTIESSVQNIHQHTVSHYFNLVIAHYVCAYTGFSELLKQSNYLLKSGGYLSFVTTTFNAFPNAQHIFKNTSWKTPLRKIFSLIALYHLRHTRVPQNAENIRQMLKENGYEILQHETAEQTVYLSDVEEAIQFMIHGSWAVELLNQRYFPQWIAMAIIRFAFSQFVYPHHDKTVVEIFLARKS